MRGWLPRLQKDPVASGSQLAHHPPRVTGRGWSGREKATLKGVLFCENVWRDSRFLRNPVVRVALLMTY